MNWLFPDKYEFLHRPCRTRRKIFGGANKDQLRNLQEIPVGTQGIARQRITEGESGTTYLLCTFRVANRRLWARCAPEMVELDPPPAV